MRFFNTTKLAQVLSVQAGIDGMKAENGRYRNGVSSPYGEKDFDKMAAYLFTLSKLPDYICYRLPEVERIGKRLVEIEKKVTPERVIKLKPENDPRIGSVPEFLKKFHYSTCRSDEFNLIRKELAKSLYQNYISYCEKIVLLEPISNVKFAEVLGKLGAYKKRMADGMTYTLYVNPDERIS